MTDAAAAAATVPAARTRVRASFAVAPLEDVNGNLATVLGESVLTLLGMFYPLPICRKANVVVTELVQNVLENVADTSSEVRVSLEVDGARIAVEVANRATPEQGAAVMARLEQLRDAVAAKKLFAETLRARRAQRLKGGLGLMRLVAENKFTLTGRHGHDGELCVRAEFMIRGSE